MEDVELWRGGSGEGGKSDAVEEGITFGRLDSPPRVAAIFPAAQRVRRGALRLRKAAQWASWTCCMRNQLPRVQCEEVMELPESKQSSPARALST